MRRAKERHFIPPWQWGIFRRKLCASLNLDVGAPDYAPMITIYQALKSVGFKETYWQFIYPDQIGGLIQNKRSTLIEIHVRFFANGLIYAEMEMGRSASLHLINRRMYVNYYLIQKLSKRLSRTHLEYFQDAVAKSKLVYPRDWLEWSSQNRFMTSGIKRKIRLLNVLSDWRTLALIMMASVVSSVADRSIVIPLLTAIMIFVYVLAPRRTQ